MEAVEFIKAIKRVVTAEAMARTVQNIYLHTKRMIMKRW